MPGYWYKKAVPEKDQTTFFPSLFSLLEDICAVKISKEDRHHHNHPSLNIN